MDHWEERYEGESNTKVRDEDSMATERAGKGWEVWEGCWEGEGKSLCWRHSL